MPFLKADTRMSNASKKRYRHHSEIFSCIWRFGAGPSLLANEWIQCSHRITAIIMRDDDAKPVYQTSHSMRRIYAPNRSKTRIIRVLSEHRWLMSVLRGMPNAIVIAFSPGMIVKCGFLSLWTSNKIIYSEKPIRPKVLRAKC